MRTIVAIFTILLLAGTTQAQEWPTFKHDMQRTGYSTSPAPGTDEIAWTFGADDGLSSPAVENYRVFVGSMGGYLYAISVFNGEELWRFKAGDQVSSPTVYGGRVYFGCHDGHLYALDTLTGKLQQKKNLGDKITAAPALHEGLLFVGTWRGTVYALHASDLSEKWSYQTGTPGMLENYPIVSSPAICGGRIYVGSNDWHLYVLNENGGFEGKFQAGYQIGTSPAVVDGVVYFGSADNRLYALNAENVENLKWRYSTGNRVLSSPAVAYGRVYFGSLDHSVYSLSLGTEDNWCYTTGGPIYSSPAVADNKIFIASQDGYLYALDARNGGLIWKHQIGATGTASPAIAYGKVFIGTEDGKLYCFGSWGPVKGGDVGKGLIYLLIAGLFALALWGLARLKPPAPKRVRKKRK